MSAEPESAPAEPSPSTSEPPVDKPRRVPERDIVVIGRTAPPLHSSLPPKKGFWRELFFLGLLAMTLCGAFYSGRMNAYQRVIVIPIPESRQSVIT